MEAALGIGPERPDTWHNHWKCRREQLLQKVTDIIIFLARLTHNRCRIDRILTVPHMANLKHRELMLKRIITEMVTERPFKTPLMWRDEALNRKFGFCRNPVASHRINGHRQLFP
ncbi:hypothetical protein D3C72_429430 [compost metagenome]